MPRSPNHLCFRQPHTPHMCTHACQCPSSNESHSMHGLKPALISQGVMHQRTGTFAGHPFLHWNKHLFRTSRAQDFTPQNSGAHALPPPPPPTTTTPTPGPPKNKSPNAACDLPRSLDVSKLYRNHKAEGAGHAADISAHVNAQHQASRNSSCSNPPSSEACVFVEIYQQRRSEKRGQKPATARQMRSGPPKNSDQLHSHFSPHTLALSAQNKPGAPRGSWNVLV